MKYFQNCQVFIREPYRDGRNNTWTGTGFMKIFDDAELVFDIKDIPATTNYEIVLRYEPQVSHTNIYMQVKIFSLKF